MTGEDDGERGGRGGGVGAQFEVMSEAKDKT